MKMIDTVFMKSTWQNKAILRKLDFSSQELELGM